MTFRPIGDVAGLILAKLEMQLAQHFPEKGAGFIPPQVKGGNTPDHGSGRPFSSCGMRDLDRMNSRPRPPTEKREKLVSGSKPNRRDKCRASIRGVKFR